MTKFQQKLLDGLCTWSGCNKKSEISTTDVDEPHGEKLQLCQSHYDEYNRQLAQEDEEHYAS